MTLILTEISRQGIAMAADSALIKVFGDGRPIEIENDAAVKLFALPALKAAISCWGYAYAGGMGIETFLKELIRTHGEAKSLEDFVKTLVKLAQDGHISPTNERTGFHIAGIVDHQGAATPTFYHVTDGGSQVLTKRTRVLVSPSGQFDAHHEEPPHLVREQLGRDVIITYRNGDYLKYAVINRALSRLSQTFKRRFGVSIPYQDDLSHRVDYLAFQIRTTSELYRMSNLYPGIGGRINALTIDNDGSITEHVLHNPTPIATAVRPREAPPRPKIAESYIIGQSSTSSEPHYLMDEMAIPDPSGVRSSEPQNWD